MAAKPKTASVDRWITVGVALVPALLVGLGAIITTAYQAGGIAGAVKQEVTNAVAPVATKVTELSTKVDAASKDAQTKVDRLSDKVDAATNAVQIKQDALSSKVDGNIAEQLTFRTSVQAWLTKLSDSQQGLSNQINQERVDRLTESAKKK